MIQDPVKKPVDDAWLDEPIDVSKIMGTPTPAPAGTKEDTSWLDTPVYSPESTMTEEPAWYERMARGAGQGLMAIPRGVSNAVAAGANLTNAAARMLPGIDEDTPGFGRVPDHPLGQSGNVGASLVENVVQFGAGFAVGGPVVKAVGVGVKGAGFLVQSGKGLSLAGNAAAGGVADFAAFDAQAGRLSDFLAEIPGMENMPTSADDGEIEGRLKNALEGLGIGAAFDGVVKLVRFQRVASKARESGKAPEQAIAEAHAAVPDVQKSLADLYDMRQADQSPFKGQMVDDALAKAKTEDVWVNVDGSEVLGFNVAQPKPKPALRDVPNEQLATMLEENFKHESSVAADVLGRELKADKGIIDAYIENASKARAGGPEAAAAQAQVDGVLAKLSSRGRKKMRSVAPSGEATDDIEAAVKYKAAGWEERQATRFVSLATTKFNDPATSQSLLKSWVNKHGTLLDNPQTTIKLRADGTAEIGVTLRVDQFDSAAERISKSLSHDMSPRELGEVAQTLTSRKPPPDAPTPVPGGAPPAPGGAPPVAPRMTPHQIYLGEVGFDAKTADEIGEILQGEFVEGVAERGRVGLTFKARGEPFTDAANPKHMSRQELLSRELRKKGLNLEGLKGQPERLAQSMRALENMNLALRQSENPLLVKETFADMSARAQVEMDTIFSIPTSWDRATYIKQAEKAGVDAVNRVGAQAKAASDMAAGIAIELHAKAVEMVARRKANLPIQPWEYAAWAESRGLAKDVLSMGDNLKNALARNLYMQRGEIIPTWKSPRITTVQLQQNSLELERVLMENGGVDKLARDAEIIAAAGGSDLYKIAETLQLARGSNGLLGMTIETGYASMLSGMGTHVAQFFGTMSVATIQPFRRGLSAATHLPFTRDPVLAEKFRDEIAESMLTYVNMFRNISETMRAYKTGFIHGPTLNPRGGATDVGSRANRQEITAKNFGLDEETPEGLMIQAVGDLMSVPGRGLQGGDEMARVMVYRSVAQARLTREGMKAGLSGPELGAAVAHDMDRMIYKGQAMSVAQLERRAFDDVQRQGFTGIHAVEKKNRLVAEWQNSDWYKRLSPLSDFAIDFGDEASMSKPLDPRTRSADLQKFLNRNPVVAFVVSPFFKTSVNIAKGAMQNFDFPAHMRWIGESKLNWKGSAYEDTTNRLLADMRSGDKVRAANARGRLLFGTTFASGVAMMYASGMVVGRGPSDKNVRKQWLDAGGEPYSFKIGEKYYSFSRFEPLATLIGLVADVSQTIEEAPDDSLPEAKDLAMGIGIAVASNLTNKSYAKGIGDFMQAITSPDEDFEYWANSIATRFVPSALRDVTTVVDPLYRQVRTTHDAMIARVPWMSGGLEPRRNILGEPISRKMKLGEESLGAWVAPVSIVRVGDASDALKSELANLEYGFSIPGSKRNGYDMFDIKSSSGQSAYDRWLENSSTTRIGGKTLRQALELTIQSPLYQSMLSESLNGEPSERASRINSIIGQYRDRAFRETQLEILELGHAELGSSLERDRMR